MHTIDKNLSDKPGNDGSQFIYLLSELTLYNQTVLPYPTLFQELMLPFS